MPRAGESHAVPALLVFVKAPRPGTAKTRLTPDLTPDEAAEIARRMVSDALALAYGVAATLEAEVVVAFTPAESWSDIEPLLGSAGKRAVVALPQRGGDLGERMANALDDAAERGLRPAVVIGTDCPAIPLHALRDAFSALENDVADVVLGPTDDGGYYLVGVREPVRGLFENVRWSTGSVMAETVANARRLGLRVDVGLPRTYDIDTPADLSRFQADLAADPTLAARAPATAEWLRRNPPATVSASGADEYR